VNEHHPFRSKEKKEKCLAMFEAMEKSNWPVESERLYIETSYGKTFIRASGSVSDPPFVLLHGMGGNSLYWGRNIKELSEEFRTYAVDTIDDYGLSVSSIPMKNSSDYVKWLDEVFAQLGLNDNISLMGHSYGGWLTSQYALNFQNRLNRIVLVAPACTIQPIVFHFYIRQILSILPFRFLKDNFFSWVDPTRKQDAETKQHNDLIEMCMKCYKPKYSIVRPTVLSDEELKSFGCPVLFLFGEKEKIYSPEKAMDRLEVVAPNIKKKIIPHAGHMSITQSTQFNKTVLAFLKEQ
jgi:pimeloyl-ACP methyl ester carboxylesterase